MVARRVLTLLHKAGKTGEQEIQRPEAWGLRSEGVRIHEAMARVQTRPHAISTRHPLSRRARAARPAGAPLLSHPLETGGI